MKVSAFGEKLTKGAGILSLMDDLGNALAEGGKIMMGGGNPGHIPQIQELMRERLRMLVEDDQALRKLIGVYDPPRGDGSFRRALAALLRREYGWKIDEDNICLTNGSQGAFFLLFNLLAGKTTQGGNRKILLPLAPEYIGYADLGLSEDFFTSVRPRIELIGDHFFKYRVNFDRIDLTEEIAAICVSRPTNPTGNVLTAEEIAGLSRLAQAHDLPLIIDNAYGLPFPGMIYTEAAPVWGKHLVLCMSLSKFGLPAARTGIVIADQELIRLLSGMNAVVNLATGSLGAMLTTELVESGEIMRLSREVIRPFYQDKMERALARIEETFSGFPYKVHVPEGAMFLWLWFPDLPVSCRQLYERLKARGVVVVAGDYFFPGLTPGWQHARECLRITYAQDDKDVLRGIGIIADEVRSIFSNKHA
ncbi:aminotransferase class I and II [Desulfobulbus propionicus DSM 2032]|jgi:valine--pyruvate aminotransferase|uniref:Aminotransferase class I and II n=1 Tax=Desulfobulbus propionicus (strain ATCC 33891 / DSM 2032 / VKM B-1956 / 1pr3) TaxID=577650 RepID=A0A7U3YLZ7_DESPD|nr:valine--pyruvate transaminase [Desulfobulbus propionicus]ADW17820.1 aminotransferase class I and II [Desulfobulbus propionicus DSM 2032]